MLTLNPFGRASLLSDVLAGIKRSTGILYTLMIMIINIIDYEEGGNAQWRENLIINAY
jgi:hypothetical protein